MANETGQQTDDIEDFAEEPAASESHIEAISAQPNYDLSDEPNEEANDDESPEVPQTFDDRVGFCFS